MTKTEQARLLRPLVEKAVATGALTDEEATTATLFFPEWDSNASYETGDRVRYDGVLYKCLQPHQAQETWEPYTAPSLWAQVLTDPSGEILDWVQPDSTNPYMTGDKVRFNGKIYRSLIDNNIWSPEAYPQGWEEVLE